jgi:hypothetical protein
MTVIKPKIGFEAFPIKKARAFILLSLFVLWIRPAVFADDISLALPEIGSASLKILAPDLLELSLVTTKAPPPARVTEWNFVAGNFQYLLPAVTKFSVTADGKPVLAQSVGFRRRPLYAAFRKRDLRIGNYLYLKLLVPLEEGQTVHVSNPDGTLWNSSVDYTAAFDPLRFSAAIHVDQQGYLPDFSKRAIVGYYLGTFGELNVPVESGFKIIRSESNEVVYEGNLTLRQDQGYNYAPLPYQHVLEADFTSFKTPGEYRILVPHLGTSLPFRIDEGVAAAFARAYALGLYHQRCGVANELPFTRFVHDPCHTAKADIPNMTYAAVNKELADFSADYTNNVRHTAPQLKNVAASLYPFVNTGKVDVSGGHHDAGDYSKYTINVAQLSHALIFAIDNFKGVAALDNLGLPESGDGQSDLMQEAKLELDFLSKMQDADGGFYFLVYPKTRAYEDNVLPDHGDPQVVFPKNTAATAAGVAALAQAASSPLFKRTYPAEAAQYLAQALKGWDFLQTAITKYGRDGAYQKISHYGDDFMHDDELAWAAAELFLATGDHSYEAELIAHFDPNDRKTLQDGWVRMWEGYGCAVRSYAFGARSGRIAVTQLNASYLSKCETEIFAAADDHARFTSENSYGTSFSDVYKTGRTASWYFAIDQAFDIATACQIDPRPNYIDAIVRDMDFEGGCNPVNVSYLTGMGVKRQREIVHQYAINDRRALPPSGLPIGSLQRGFMVDLPLYPNELPGLCFPQDYATVAPYAPYDTWGDCYNVLTEFVTPQQGHGLASLAYLMAMTSLKDQPWKPVSGQIQLANENVLSGTKAKATFTAPGLNLSTAKIIWEGRYQEPTLGPSFEAIPAVLGPYWLEVEALLPDGRRIFAASQFTSVAGHSVSISGQNQISISGTAGQNFTLQASNNLVEWQDILTDTLVTDSYNFFDEVAGNAKARFYRAVAAP